MDELFNSNENIEKPKKTRKRKNWSLPFAVIPLSYFLVELFAFCFLSFENMTPWPLAFGALWALLLSGVIRAIPQKAGRIFYGITFFLTLAYSAVQTGYYILFH
jgi:hypothetical protein